MGFMDTEKKSLLYVHLSALLLGFLAPALKVIPSTAGGIVLGRSLIQSIAIMLLLIWMGRPLLLRHASHWWQVLALGILQSVQWWAFIYAVQTVSVAVALITTFAFPLWLALLEPLFFSEKFTRSNLVASLAILAGLVLIATEGLPQSSLPLADRSGENVAWTGFAAGMASGVLVALIMLLSRKAVQELSSLSINLYQSLVSVLLFALFFRELGGLLVLDWLRLAYIAIVFSAVPYVLITLSVRTLSAHRVGAIVSLEPLYGVILAAFLLDEIPSLLTTLGGAFILGASAWETLRKTSCS
ncbi:MAG: hypothetical protein CMN76_03870 [Spirochaetaceae bacterium]|nr:hypothetical protein [Spirochaetaceae bacterium]|tara:strand:- start:236500 stop:237399 length:900 start_codon:yes stop_codon:yes gene_type:complete